MNFDGQKAALEWTNNSLAPKESDLLIKSCCTSAGSAAAITIWNQSLAHNLARTEVLCRSSEKPVLAHIGSKRTAHSAAHLV
jgi:hypothetical protein